MTRVTLGHSRTVFLVGRYAIKVPVVCYGWRAFLRGLLANLSEAEWARWTDAARVRLCPVVTALPGGFALVMRRARPLSEAEFGALDVEAFLCYAGDPLYRLPVEAKADSFGMLDGRVVAVDYADHR